MFLTKQEIEDCLTVLKAYENVKTEEQVKIIVANKLAREMFDNFDKLSAEEKADILSMIIEDMSIDNYALN
jgi:hypothetical protein